MRSYQVADETLVLAGMTAFLLAAGIRSAKWRLE